MPARKAHPSPVAPMSPSPGGQSGSQSQVSSWMDPFSHSSLELAEPSPALGSLDCDSGTPSGPDVPAEPDSTAPSDSDALILNTNSDNVHSSQSNFPTYIPTLKRDDGGQSQPQPRLRISVSNLNPGVVAGVTPLQGVSLQGVFPTQPSIIGPRLRLIAGRPAPQFSTALPQFFQPRLPTRIPVQMLAGAPFIFPRLAIRPIMKKL